MPCRDASGAVVAVDPTPIAGGDLLVNATLDRIVMRLSAREAVAAARRHELGFVVHARVCLAASSARSPR
jgi:hypothetical protein